MATMLNVYDRATRKKTAVLQNAFNIVETQEINQIYSLSFTLPSEDEKNRYCLPRHFVRYGENGELYRIKSPKVNDTSVGTVVYECEHVITTLCDDIMFGSFIYGGMGVPTRETITWILSKQKTVNWRLGQCAFSRQFEYNWEQENLLNALYSIPKEFAASYMWTFDTLSYPWTINLVEINKNATPEYYLRAKSNILASGTSADYANICTRIYPLGYGEGVNQLTIREATVDGAGNPVESGGTRYGLPYIQSPQSYINKYGIVEKVMVDRRFEQPNTLYGYAKSMLAIYQEPTMSRTFDVTDLYPITNKPLDDAQIGKICKLTKDNSIAYITKTVRQWDLAGDLHIDLSTKASDIASNVADLADRIRIESVYAQGATQLYQHSKDANATSDKGMNISLYFPSEMKQINKVMLKLELKRFRYYAATTAGGGSINKTTGDGGYTSRSTSDGGYTSTSTSEGGATVNTGIASGGGGITATPSVSVSVNNTGQANWKSTGGSAFFYTNPDGTTGYTDSKGDHSHTVYGNTNNTTPQSSDNYRHYHPIDAGSSYAATNGSHTHNVTVDSHSHRIYTSSLQHNHSVNATASITVKNGSSSGFGHTHTVNLPSHTHEFTVPSHNHSFTVPNHNHSIEVGDHTHTINPGIFESTESPTKFDIYVGGTKKTTIESTRYSDDITQWLLNDKNLIPRNSWINVEIRPDTMAYVVSSVFVQGFVQSRGGGNY